VARYEGPAFVEWTKKGSSKAVRVRCVCESFMGGLWQGQLVEFPDKLANIWPRADTLNLSLPDAAPALIRPTRVSSELLRPVALGFTGVGPPPFDGVEEPDL
jgi:hypothetical protein